LFLWEKRDSRRVFFVLSRWRIRRRGLGPVTHIHFTKQNVARRRMNEARQREEGRGKREEGRGKREEGRGKREEGRGKREEGRGKREEGRGKSASHTGISRVAKESQQARLMPRRAGEAQGIPLEARDLVRSHEKKQSTTRNRVESPPKLRNTRAKHTASGRLRQKYYRTQGVAIPGHGMSGGGNERQSGDGV
jgi:hypothetical protein